MPALFFPNPDAVRLAIAAGIVPPDVARRPVRAGFDTLGRVWVDPPADLPRDAVAGLQRIGVQFLPPGTVPPTRGFDGWGELLTLRPSNAPPAGPVLLEVPDADLARVAAEVVRVKPQKVRARFLPTADPTGPGRAWLLTSEPPTFTLANPDPAGRTEAFVEQAPRAWVLVGWRHPLDDRIPVPDGFVAVLRPPGNWVLFPDEPFVPERDVFPLPPRSVPPSPRPPRVGVPLRLRLTRVADPGPGPDAAWVLAGADIDRLEALARGTDERLLRPFQIATAESPTSRRVILRCETGAVGPVPGVGGWGPHPDLSNLLLPAGHRLTPAVRPATLAALLGVRPGWVTWLEPDPTAHSRGCSGPTNDPGYSVHAVPAAAFRPLRSLIEYFAPPATRLTPATTAATAFEFPRFALETDRRTEVAPPPRPVPSRPTFRPASPPSPGWLARSILRVLRAVPPVKKPSKTRGPKLGSAGPTGAGRAGEKLASPQVLLLGNEWAARRAALENRVLTDLPGLSPADRAEVWADLAEVYGAVGNPADAAVCWANAIWDRDPPPTGWLVNWLKAEARAARLGKDALTPDALVESPATVQTARLTAAFLTWAGGPTTPAADLGPYLPYLLELLDAHEPDLPARAVWLARSAAARLTAGDPLGLARCRDRLFRRLVDDGPGLDLDAPSFLRFQGTAGTDRPTAGSFSHAVGPEPFQTAREWLTRLRDPVRKWLERLVGAGRLQWAGLDPEFPCTAAYADLMLAWGLSKLGDRGRAKDLETAAADLLGRATGPGVDPAVHRVLVAGFRDRVRSAQDGRPPRPGLPTPVADDLAGLDDLGRYAVDRLRACSRILEPVDRVNPYRGRELRGFLGVDPLGDRLAGLLEHPDRPLPQDAVRAVAAEYAADPSFRTLPRAVLTLLELAPRLDPGAAAGVLGWAAVGLEQTPAWVRAVVPGADRPGVVARYEARFLAAAAHAAARFHQPEPMARVLGYLRDACPPPGATTRRALEAVAADFFRAVRSLGLVAEARDLLARLDADPVPRSPGPLDLGLAVGWFAVGHEDAGMRVLDAARDRLFNRPIPDLRERTAVAVGYATGLGHAPTRVALGRLEELFLRLDVIDTRGAANRYFTAQPLELIDGVIRSVVSDDFAVGPGVRGWLDDDEYLIRRRITRDLAAAVAE